MLCENAEVDTTCLEQESVLKIVRCLQVPLRPLEMLTVAADLKLKPVYFHVHFYTVLEHGQRAGLSIVKLTQEKGAASSFYKVVETLEMVLKEHGDLVVDPAQKRALEKTVKEIGL